MTHNWGSGDPRTSTAAWRRLRRTILERDNKTCTTCGQPATEVDHIRNTKAGGTDHPDNRTSTCRTQASLKERCCRCPFQRLPLTLNKTLSPQPAESIDAFCRVSVIGGASPVRGPPATGCVRFVHSVRARAIQHRATAESAAQAARDSNASAIATVNSGCVSSMHSSAMSFAAESAR